LVNMDEQVVAFIDRNLKINKINRHNLLIISDANVLKGIANEGAFDYVMSSAELNGYVRLNESLTQIHRLLSHRGLFFGCVETNEQHAKRLLCRHRGIIGRIAVSYAFIFRRVLPKLVGFRWLQQHLGIVRHRVLSKCEALGRLRFAGFKILKLAEINDRLYFICRKSVRPRNGTPCDGLLVKIQKVGLRGRTIHCYKMRTMHSYANYLHDYILKNLKIDNNGKVVGDFRVPGWAKVVRKLWLDEMPQLFNILKGDLSFIGLRHLSKEFLELYPEDWRTERHNIKPGFVPPYYADCPKTFEEIIESEKKYYRLKRKHPLTTDVYYFVRVVISFLMMKARTG
jgi:lipopolysaccharide/colanic/teichoic acid biosynthesis glycosyltransferase